MRNTAAVVVTYNRKELLSSCISCLLSQEYPCDILIIDNASTDGTEEMLQPLIDAGKIRYHNTGENLGGAGGFAEGMKTALKMGYEYLWLMDDDTEVHTDALKELFDADRRLGGAYGFLSGVAYFRETDEPCRMNIQRTDWHTKVSDYESPEVPVVMATFVSFFVKAETVRRFGLPIREFFIWADDLEYSRRISRELPCYMVPSSRADHMMKSNEKVGIEQESEDRLWRYRCLYRNERYLYRREGMAGRFYLLLRICYHSYKVLAHAESGKAEKLKTIWRSYRDGRHFHPVTEYPD